MSPLKAHNTYKLLPHAILLEYKNNAMYFTYRKFSVLLYCFAHLIVDDMLFESINGAVSLWHQLSFSLYIDLTWDRFQFFFGWYIPSDTFEDVNLVFGYKKAPSFLLSVLVISNNTFYPMDCSISHCFSKLISIHTTYIYHAYSCRTNRVSKNPAAIPLACD